MRRRRNRRNRNQKVDITNYSLNLILRLFFSDPNKSYNYNGEHFTNAQQMYNWILDRKQEFKDKGELVRINFDPRASQSYKREYNTLVPVEVELPEVVVEAPRKQGKSTGEVLHVDKLYRDLNLVTPYDRYFMNAPENDYESLLGDYRVKLVLRAWEDPYTRLYVMEPFREASNTTGNIAALTILGVPALAAAGSALAAGQVGSVVGGALGGYLGMKGVDSLVDATTDYSSVLDFIDSRDGGMWPITVALQHPGAAAGSLLGSTIGSGLQANVMLLGQSPLYQNAYATFANNNPRIAMTSEGPITLLPGQVLRLSGRDALPPGQSYGSEWQGLFNPRGYTRSGGQTNEGSRSQMSGARPGKKTSTPSRPEKDWTPAKGKRDTYTTVPETYVPYNTHFYPLYFPGVPTTPTPTPPPPPPIITIPKPETRYELITDEEDPYITWFRKQKTGSRVKWEGDPNSMYPPTGWFIVRRTQADPVFETRKVAVGTDNTKRRKGLVARDSVTRRRLPASAVVTPAIRELPGAVDPNAVLTDENIFYKKGGKLFKRLF